MVCKVVITKLTLKLLLGSVVAMGQMSPGGIFEKDWLYRRLIRQHIVSFKVVIC